MTVNKPLILEPALPAFGNVKDLMDLSAVLHNNTDETLELELNPIRTPMPGADGEFESHYAIGVVLGSVVGASVVGAVVRSVVSGGVVVGGGVVGAAVVGGGSVVGAVSSSPLQAATAVNNAAAGDGRRATEA